MKRHFIAEVLSSLACLCYAEGCTSQAQPATATSFDKAEAASGSCISEGETILRARPLRDEATLHSVGTTVPTSIRFENRTAKTLVLLWIDFDGKRQEYHLLKPNVAFFQRTFVGHVWIVADSTGRDVALFVAEQEPGVGVVGG
jgi:hypothetical protein